MNYDVSDSETPALFRPVDIASLVFFRIAYGGVMLFECYRYIASGWIRSAYIRPDFHFTYHMFGWVKPWPGEGMIIHFWVLGGLSILMMLGLFYRLSALLVWLLFTQIFLIEQAKYLNHFYLVSLIGFLMIFIPAHRAYSLDAWLWPQRRSATVPAWALWIMRFMIGVPYFFGGIAKITPDWLAGEPMTDWLGREDDFPIIGQFFDEHWMVMFFCWSGLLIDLLAVPFLLIRSTRGYALFVLVLFHFTNTRLFNIGIFPWFMIAATPIFCDPDWPRRVYHDVWRAPNRRGAIALFGVALGGIGAAWFRQGVELVPCIIGAFGVGLIFWQVTPEDPNGEEFEPDDEVYEPILEADDRRHGLTTALFALWVAVQCALPLRHFFIPGNVHWTEDGHRFAWHMKLRDKDGEIRYTVRDPETGETERVNPRGELTSRQYRKLATRPYMMRLYAIHLSEQFEEERGWEDAEVYCRAEVSLNGRHSRPMVDTTVDLSKEPFYWWRTPWVLDLDEPLKRPDAEP